MVWSGGRTRGSGGVVRGRTRGSGGVVTWEDESEWWCGEGEDERSGGVVRGRTRGVVVWSGGRTRGVVVWSGGRTRGSGGVVRWEDEREWWCGQVGGREGVVVW